jgi:hypothetical protein
VSLECPKTDDLFCKIHAPAHVSLCTNVHPADALEQYSASEVADLLARASEAAIESQIILPAPCPHQPPHPRVRPAPPVEEPLRYVLLLHPQVSHHPLFTMKTRYAIRPWTAQDQPTGHHVLAKKAKIAGQQSLHTSLTSTQVRTSGSSHNAAVALPQAAPSAAHSSSSFTPTKSTLGPVTA